MALLVTTFGSRAESEWGRAVLEDLALDHQVLDPAPGYGLVGAPAVIADESARTALARQPGRAFVCAGWVEYRQPEGPLPDAAPLVPVEGLFGRADIVVLAPCVADPSRIRIIAQVTGDVAPALPYLNAVMERASYNPQTDALTFMDDHRLVSVQAHRITVAKADEIVDAWRTLEGVRQSVETVWAGRADIEPSYETRERPPALEIFRRLPRTNCKACGRPTCLAFAVAVWQGDAAVTECPPVHREDGAYAGLREALDEVCAALGV